MSDTTSGPDWLGGMFGNPTVMGLLGAAQGAAQAAMPSRMPVPMGAALGMAGAGLMQGGQSAQAYQMKQQQLDAARMQNQLTAASQPYKLALLQSALGGSLPGGVPGMGAALGGMAGAGGAGGGMPAGGTGQPGAGAGGVPTMGLPHAGQGGAPLAFSPANMLGTYQYMLALDPAAASRMAATITSAMNYGYGMDANGNVVNLPGYVPSMYARESAKGWAGVGPATAKEWGTVGPANAKAWGAVGPDLAKGGMVALPDGSIGNIPGYVGAQADRTGATEGAKAGAQAPYQAPIVVQQAGPDGVVRDVQIPVPQWSAQNQPQPRMMPATDFATRVAGYENPSGDPNARNPRSTATGNGQFIDGTWVPLMRQMYPAQTQGMSDQDVLALRSNPDLARAATIGNAQSNAAVLGQNGFAPTGGNLAIAHNLGPQAATAVLSAPKEAPMASVLSPQAVQANPDLAKQTVGQYRANMAFKFGTAPVDFSNGAPRPISGGIVGKPTYTPEQQAESSAYGAQSADVINAGAQAPKLLEKVQVLRNAANNYRTGATGQLRMDAGKALVDVLQSVGITPPAGLADGTASAEVIGKLGTQLTSDQVRALGSREAAAIYNQVRSSNPNVDMTQQGFDVVLRSIEQGAMRDQKRAQFREMWVSGPSHNGSVRGMETAFDRAYPPEMFASRVMPFSQPSNLNDLKSGVLYRNKAGQVAVWNGSAFTPVGAGQ